MIKGPRRAGTLDGLRVEVDATSEGDETIREVEALSVVAGNLRRFIEANERTNAEDGALEVLIVEPMSVSDAAVESVKRRSDTRGTSHMTDLEADRLEIVGEGGATVTFSLDGEIGNSETIRTSVRPRARGPRGARVRPVERRLRTNEGDRPLRTKPRVGPLLDRARDDRRGERGRLTPTRMYRTRRSRLGRGVHRGGPSA